MKAARIAIALATTTGALSSMVHAQGAAQIEAVGRLGATLFQFDRAAWLASDAATEALKANGRPLDGGYVIERGSDDTLNVTFFSGRGGARQAIFTAEVSNGKVGASAKLAAPVALTAAQMRLADARDAAAAETVSRGWRPCGNLPFNPIVLPPERDDGRVHVYLLTPQTKAGSFPMGGHFRFDIDAAGQVANARAFTKSCVESAPPPPAKGRPAMLAVSHLLDPIPTELHVFTSYAARLPLAVILPSKQIWIVTGRNIRRVKDD